MLVVAAVYLSGCGGSHASSFHVRYALLPDLLAKNYVIRGSYPLVAGSSRAAGTVNALLTEAVRSDELAFAAVARRQPAPPRGVGPGLYAAHPIRGLINVRSAVVSVLVPVTRLFPGGTDGQGWIATTIDVRRERRITLANLFGKHERRALSVLARAARRRAVATSACIRHSVDDPSVGRAFLSGFSPTPAHYRYFALLEGGIAVGFPVGEVAFPTCNRVDVLVPYAVFRPYLSARALELLAQST
jgi:hypothetical protein